MTKIDFTKPVQTRDGRSVRILCTDRKSYSHEVVGLVESEEGIEYLYSWSLNGKRFGLEESLNLVNVPEKKTIYQFTVYDKKGQKFYTTNIESKKEAQIALSFYKTNNDFKVVTGIQEVTFEVPND